MAKAKLLLARIDTFTKAGRYVPRGMTVSSDEVDFDPKTSDNLTEAPEGAAEGVVIEMSAIAPTGPNPKNPQQIAPGTVQTTDGYVDRGARLVGEVTLPEKQRIEVVGIDPESTVQDDVSAALEEADADAAEKERARRAEAGSGSRTMTTHSSTARSPTSRLASAPTWRTPISTGSKPPRTTARSHARACSAPSRPSALAAPRLLRPSSVAPL
jgi:hypothetical protein